MLEKHKFSSPSQDAACSGVERDTCLCLTAASQHYRALPVSSCQTMLVGCFSKAFRAESLKVFGCLHLIDFHRN